MLDYNRPSLGTSSLRYTTWYATGVFAVYLVCSFLPFAFASTQTVDALSKEDNFYEWFGASSLFVGSMLLLLQYVFDTHGNDFGIFRTKKNVFLLFLGLVLLFGFGEEISWGQRILHIKTPDFFMKYNTQQEMNIHNITFFHGYDPHNLRKTGLSRFTGTDFLFSLFWFSFTVLLPLVSHHLRRVREFTTRINIPIPPIWIGMLMMGTYALSKLMEFEVPATQSHDITEVKESNLELLLYAYTLLMFGGSEAYQALRTMLLSLKHLLHAETPHQKGYSPANHSLHS